MMALVINDLDSLHHMGYQEYCVCDDIDDELSR